MNNYDRNILFPIYIFKFVKTIIEYFHKSLKTSLEIVSNILDSAIAKFFSEKIKFETQKNVIDLIFSKRHLLHFYQKKEKEICNIAIMLVKRFPYFPMIKKKICNMAIIFRNIETEA